MAAPIFFALLQIFFFISFYRSETPHFLLQKDRPEEARRVLASIYREEDIERAFEMVR
jgi:hypothetical protein